MQGSRGNTSGRSKIGDDFRISIASSFFLLIAILCKALFFYFCANRNLHLHYTYICTECKRFLKVGPWAAKASIVFDSFFQRMQTVPIFLSPDLLLVNPFTAFSPAR